MSGSCDLPSSAENNKAANVETDNQSTAALRKEENGAVKTEN